MGGGRKGCSGQSPRAEGLKVALLGWVPCSEGELALCTPPAVLLQGGTCNSTLPLSEAGRGPPGTAAAQRLSPGTAWPWLQPSGTQLPEAEAEPDSNLIAQGSNHIRGGRACCPSRPAHLLCS